MFKKGLVLKVNFYQKSRYLAECACRKKTKQVNVKKLKFD